MVSGMTPCELREKIADLLCKFESARQIQVERDLPAEVKGKILYHMDEGIAELQAALKKLTH